MFKGKQLPVELLRLQSSLAPDYFFFVTIGNDKALLKRSSANGQTAWIGGSPLSHQDAQLLGPEIEKQLGHSLPRAESNNPFEYKGDIEITITKFFLGKLPIERAKAPYSSNLVYRIYTPVLMIELEKSFYFTEKGQWHLNTNNLLPKRFKQLTELIDQYEAQQDNL